VRLSRRQAMVMGATAFLGHGAAAAPLPQGDEKKSWIGKTVMPKKYAATAEARPIELGPKAGVQPYTRTLRDASYSVKGEKGTQVEIFDDEYGCMIEKQELVLLEDAVEFFTKSLKVNDKDTFALTSRGWAYYLMGKPDKAVADFDAFLKLTPAGHPSQLNSPGRWEGLVNRGLVLAEQGEFAKAIRDLDEAVRDGQASEIARVNRGYTYSLMGEYEKAIAEYRGARHVLTLNNFAWLRATCPIVKFRNATEAVYVAKVICDATDNREGMYLDTLAAAYAEAGQFDDAVKTQEKALKDKSFVARYGNEAQMRLNLYKDKKPYRMKAVKKKD
jgi:tetratricopeptide (TPR) repeat protein